MNENEPVEKKKTHNTSPPRGGPPKKILRRTFADRLRAVKLHLEEGFTQETVAREMEISTAALGKWLVRYRRDGEEGLKDQDRKASANKLPEAVRDKILQLKREEPTRGVSFCPPAARRFAKRSRKRVWCRARPKPGATSPGPDSSNEPRPTRCGRRISSRSGWEANTPTSSDSWMIIPGSSSGPIYFAVTPRKMCWRFSGWRPANISRPGKCSPTTAGSTSTGGAPPASRRR